LTDYHCACASNAEHPSCHEDVGAAWQDDPESIIPAAQVYVTVAGVVGGAQLVPFVM
jgi:hypothetical protein